MIGAIVGACGLDRTAVNTHIVGQQDGRCHGPRRSDINHSTDRIGHGVDCILVWIQQESVESPGRHGGVTHAGDTMRNDGKLRALDRAICGGHGAHQDRFGPVVRAETDENGTRRRVHRDPRGVERRPVL